MNTATVTTMSQSVDLESLQKELENLRHQVERLNKENDVLLQAIKAKNERLLANSKSRN